MGCSSHAVRMVRENLGAMVSFADQSLSQLECCSLGLRAGLASHPLRKGSWASVSPVPPGRTLGHHRTCICSCSSEIRSGLCYHKSTRYIQMRPLEGLDPELTTPSSHSGRCWSEDAPFPTTVHKTAGTSPSKYTLSVSPSYLG